MYSVYYCNVLLILQIYEKSAGIVPFGFVVLVFVFFSSSLKGNSCLVECVYSVIACVCVIVYPSILKDAFMR